MAPSTSSHGDSLRNLATSPSTRIPTSGEPFWGLAARQALEETIRLGTVYAAIVEDQVAALALWHPPGTRPASALERARHLGRSLPQAPTILRGLPPAVRVAVPHMLQALQMARVRNAAVKRASRGPTWHLAFLATFPEHRGKGLARCLLDRQLARCDADHLPIWLETTDPVNPPIYERFGFKTTAHITDAAWLPGFWVMRREPRPEAQYGTGRE